MKIQVDDLEFKYTKMKLRPQMKLWAVLAKDIGPLIPRIKDLQAADLSSETGQMEILGTLLKEAGSVLENAETYYAALAEQTEVMFQPMKKYVALPDFEDQIFKHPGQVVEFVVKALKEEFGPLLESLDAKAAPEPSQENESK